MTLDEAIKHAEEVAEEKRCEKCGEEHRQLAEWLKELKQLRKQEKKGHWIDHSDEGFKGLLNALNVEVIQIVTAI